MSLDTNLFAYYKLETNVNDSTANGYNGTSSAGVSYSNDGKIGKCATYASTDNYISLPSGVNSGLGGDFTFAFWYYPTSVSDTEQLLYDWGGSTKNIYIAVSAGTLQFFLGNGSSQDTLLTKASGFSINTRYFVVFKVSGTTKSISVNAGTPTTQTSSISSRVTTANQIYLGLTSGSITGRVDEVGFWNRSISGAEETELYNGGTGFQYPFATATSPSFLMMF